MAVQGAVVDRIEDLPVDGCALLRATADKEKLPQESASTHSGGERRMGGGDRRLVKNHRQLIDSLRFAVV